MRVLAVSTVPDVASLIRSNDLSQRVLCGSERGPLRFPSPRVAKRSGREGKGREGKGREGGEACTTRTLVDSAERATPTPDPSPPFASRIGGGEGSRRDGDSLRRLPLSPAAPRRCRVICTVRPELRARHCLNVLSYRISSTGSLPGMAFPASVTGPSQSPSESPADYRYCQALPLILSPQFTHSHHI